jgi:hypothetical protein
MAGFFTKAEPGEAETPAASENFPKLGQTGKRDFFSRKQLFMVREGRLRFSYIFNTFSGLLYNKRDISVRTYIRSYTI